MAGPLTGPGAQQVQLYSQNQAGQQNSNQVRQQEERQQPVENKTQARGTAAAETQTTDTDVQSETLSRDQVEQRAAESNERGTLLDITV